METQQEFLGNLKLKQHKNVSILHHFCKRSHPLEANATDNFQTRRFYVKQVGHLVFLP